MHPHEKTEKTENTRRRLMMMKPAPHARHSGFLLQLNNKLRRN